MPLTIGGVSYDAWLDKGSLVHTSTLGSEPDALEFSLAPRGAGGAVLTTPAMGAEVLFTLPDTSRLFGGVLTSRPAVPRGFLSPGVRCVCSDWRARVNRAVMNDRLYQLTAGQVIKALFAKYAPEFDTSQVDTTGRFIGSIRFKRDSHLTDVLDRLSALTGYVWDITPDRVVTWGAPGATLAPFALTDTSANFSGLSVEVNRDQLRNRVIIRGDRYPSPTSTTDRFTGDALTSTFRLSGLPYGTQQYEVFRSDFTGGLGAEWVQADVSNPSPPAGHGSADGYLITTIQQGSTVSQSGWLQVLGGNSTWGAVRLMAATTLARSAGRRFEWEVYATTTAGQGRVGLWNPASQSALAGELYGVYINGATLAPSIGGVVQGTTTETITAGATFRVRITLKAAGATIEVNKDSTGNLALPEEQRVAWRASRWVTLLDTATGTTANVTVAAIFNHTFNGRVRRLRAYDPLYGVVLTVGGVSKKVGLLGVDEDSGCDALIGTQAGDVPVLAFFADTVPASAAAVVITYTVGLPILLEVRDQASIDALAAIEADPLVPSDLEGVYSHYIEDKNLTSRELALARATQELDQWANPLVTIGFSTTATGLRAGQLLAVNLTAAASGYDLADTFLIQSVTTRSLGGSTFEAQVVATSRLKGGADYLLELLRLGARAEDAEDENSPLEELVWEGDTLSFTDLVTLTGPQATGTGDAFDVTDLGSVASGPLPPYQFGTAQFGLATFA
jgi:hypothetical protein